MFQKKIKWAALLSAMGTMLGLLVFRETGAAFGESLAITMGTLCYHMVMRLLVGYGVDGKFHNRMDYRRPWFGQRKWEPELYKALRVKAWKEHMPTYNPGIFAVEAHTPEELVMAMCQAEVVHEIIAVLSFLPLFAIPWLGGAVAFWITSLLAAAFDMMFAIMQRYNRPRILRIMERQARPVASGRGTL